MVFGERLANLRKLNGWSQEQLAEKLDLTRQTISKWELNQSTPDIDYIVKLSMLFSVSTDFLIKGEESGSNHILNQEGAKVSDTQPLTGGIGHVHVYKWCFYLGLVSIVISLIGIIVFVFCAALNPWNVVINDRVYDGILGFCMGTKTLWFFVVLCIVCLLGVALSIYGIVKQIEILKVKTTVVKSNYSKEEENRF